MNRPGGERPREDGLGVRPEVQRISQVLAGLEYPAARWQILAEADHYGADSTSLAQLWTLRPGTYRDLAGVLAELGLAPVARTSANRSRSNRTGSNRTRSNPTGSNPTGSNRTGSNRTGSNPTEARIAPRQHG